MSPIALASVHEGLCRGDRPDEVLVDATAAAIAAAEDLAGWPAALDASLLRLNTPEGPPAGDAAPGLGKTISAAAEKAAAVRNLLNEAAVVESVSGDPADTGTSPAVGDIMVGTLYTVDSGNEPPAAVSPLSVLAYQELVLWYGDR